jgi:Holliday junction resolvase RusA-like endonuclease
LTLNSRSYVLPGSPIPLLRARYSHKSDRIYDPQKLFKTNCSLFIKHQHAGAPLFCGPLKVAFRFYLGLPKSRRNDIHSYHISTPDLSNLIKLVEDVCTGVIYHDDCLISEISAIKCYSESPRTEFTVTELI